MNLITADIALAADHPAKCEVQRHFLELHDAQTKRYSGQAEISVLGCVTHLTCFKVFKRADWPSTAVIEVTSSHHAAGNCFPYR